MKDYIKEDNLRIQRIKDIIDLIMLMQSRTQGISLAEIQEEFEVSRRTAQRMKDVVISLYPDKVAELQENSKIKRWGFKGRAVNLYNFNADNIADLENIKELCKINNLSNKIDVLNKIIESIKSANNPNLITLENDLESLMECEGYALRQGASFKIDNKILSTIRTAFKSMKKLEFSYQARDYYDINEKNLAGFRVQKGLKPKKMVIAEPLGILYGEKHYLVAKNNDKIKQFLLHRISDIKILDEYFTPDSDFNFKEWANTSFGIFHDELMNVKLKFKKEIAPDVMKYNFHPTQQIKQQKNGAVIVTFTSSGIKSILWNIFKWGTNVEIVAPRELKVKYIDMLNTILSAQI
ncbi:WYL domain-containing transcriptional regulator [bacterium]|nr:WYL domain-containing transcriptional regulator [bacterium]